MRLRELRKEKGITMKELGKVVGLAESTISLYENNKRQADYETLLKFAEFFGCSLDCLLGRNTNSQPSTPILSDKDIMFALLDGDKYEEIPDEVFNEVKEFAQWIAEKKMREQK
ncbi:MAG: helix-turn-helix transcriptional regulator [Oscillospiraceae bacterium]|nr:helix-turn-helix transcriptional regulator [Oscillospiraceae bacterium]